MQNDKPSAPKPSPWRTSDAKKDLASLLDEDSDGRIHAMSVDDVYMLSPLFQVYEKANFKTNLKNLKESIRKTREQAVLHEEALRHDRKLVPVKPTPRGYPRFDTSVAKQLLEKDVKDNKHKGIKPRIFQQSRPEYLDFPLDVFRKHIYQAEYAQNGRSYWMHKKKTQEEKKR